MRGGRDKKLLPLFFLFCVLELSGCSLWSTRPVQEMSDTSTAIRAAREVKADVVAPELFRQAREWWLKARKAYKFKEYSNALEFSYKARLFAERAEYEAMRGGSSREALERPPDPLANQAAPKASEDEFAKPDTEVYVEDYEALQKKNKDATPVPPQ